MVVETFRNISECFGKFRASIPYENGYRSFKMFPSEYILYVLFCFSGISFVGRSWSGALVEIRTDIVRSGSRHFR